MNTAGDRLEIINIECIWEQVTVPAHNIKRASCIDIVVEMTILADTDQIFTELFVYHKLTRSTEIALTERTVLKKLAEVIAISLRGKYG